MARITTATLTLEDGQGLIWRQMALIRGCSICWTNSCACTRWADLNAAVRHLLEERPSSR